VAEFSRQSSWGNPEQQRRWTEVLRRTGPKNVRVRLAQINAGLPSGYVACTQVRRLRSQLILSICLV
jgi:hypothetical protein